jgi:tRNA-specific 2-thiouridylase
MRGNDSGPLYVVDKNTEKNQLIIGYEDDTLLWKKEIIVSETNWISGLEPKFPLECEVRLRHRQPLQKSKILNQKSKILNQKSKIIIKFVKPQRAATPGQFAVLYLKSECLGGGVIS